MALAVRQIIPSVRTSATQIQITYASAVLSGSLLVACGAMFNNESTTEATVSDSVNGGWPGATTSGYWYVSPLDATGHLGCWSFPNSAAGTPQVTMNPDGTNSDNDLTLFEITGAATTAPRDISVSASNALGSPSVATGTLAQADEIIISAFSHHSGTSTLTGDTAESFIQADENENNSTGQCFHLQYKIVAATTSVTVDGTISPGAGWFTAVASFKQAPAQASWEQEGFRWRADDGDEDGASWLATQDTNITRQADTNTRLRILVDTADADPASTQMRLEHKLSTDSVWLPVAALVTAPTVAWRDTFQSASSNATSFNVTWDAGVPVAGQLLVLVYSVDGVETCTINTTNFPGWVKLNDADASDGAAMTQTIFYKVSTGGETNVTVNHTSEQATAIILCINNGGTPTGTSTGGSSTNADPTSHDAGSSKNYLWIATCGHDSTVVATGAPGSYGNLTTQAAAGTGGASTSVADRTATAQTENPGAFTSNNEQWAAWTLAVPPVLAAVHLAPSDNITANGENTTAQLTAPASGSFGGGRIQDDENPADAIDLALNEYGEWEWCVRANSATVTEEQVYQFRLTRNGTELDTYTVTPTMTIAGAAEIVTATPAHAVWQAEAPTVLRGAYTLQPTPARAVFAVETPTPRATKTLTPTPALARYHSTTPTLILGISTRTPSPARTVWRIATPHATSGGQFTTPSPAMTVWRVAAPTVLAGQRILTPNPVPCAWKVAAPQIDAGITTLLPAPASAEWRVATPHASLHVVCTPQPVSTMWHAVSVAASVPSFEASDFEADDFEVSGEGGLTLTPSPARTKWRAMVFGTIKRLTILAPSVSLVFFAHGLVSGLFTARPAPATTRWQVPTPTVQTGAIILTPAPVRTEWRSIAPQVVRGTVTLTPSPAQGFWQVETPTAQRGSVTVSPPTTQTQWQAETPAIQVGERTLTPNATTVSWKTATPILGTGAFILAPSPASVYWHTTDADVVLTRTLMPQATQVVWQVEAVQTFTERTLVLPSTATIWTVPPPTVTNIGAAGQANPNPVHIRWQARTPVIVRSATILTPDAVQANWYSAAPSLHASLSLSLSATPTSWRVSTPSLVSGEKTLTPEPIRATWHVTMPQVRGGDVTITPAATQAVWHVNAVTRSASTRLSLSPVSTHWHVTDPALVMGEYVLNPDPAHTTWTVAAPQAGGGGIQIAPSATQGIWHTPAPTVSNIGAPGEANPQPVQVQWHSVSPSVVRGMFTLRPAPSQAYWNALAVALNATRKTTPASTATQWRVGTVEMATGQVTLTPQSVQTRWQVAAAQPRIAGFLTPQATRVRWHIRTPVLTRSAQTLTPQPATAAWRMTAPGIQWGNTLRATPARMTIRSGPHDTFFGMVDPAPARARWYVVPPTWFITPAPADVTRIVGPMELRIRKNELTLSVTTRHDITLRI